jgi:hypothetical protein
MRWVLRVPQWLASWPHVLLDPQQFPKPLPWQVRSTLAPHVPPVEIEGNGAVDDCKEVDVKDNEGRLL